MELGSIVAIVLSIITAATAVAAIIVSVVQLSKSNKQSLLDRRIKIFLAVKQFKSLCDEQKTICKPILESLEKGPDLSMDLFYKWMTNCSFLEEIQPVIEHVLESEWQRKYLLKMEELKNMSEEARLTFPNSIGSRLAEFVFCYQEMLVCLYKYQVLIKKFSETCEKEKKPFPEHDGVENAWRTKLIKIITNTFVLAEKVIKQDFLDKVRSQIRL